MNTPSANDTKKIALVVFILVILLIAIIIVRGKKTQLTPLSPQATVTTKENPTSAVKLPDLGGGLVFDPAKVDMQVGSSAELPVFISAKNKLIDGADAIINYDPLYIEVKSVTPGIYFKNYPLQKIDSKTGTVKVMGFERVGVKLLSENTLFFTLSVTAKKAGTTGLTIKFQKGKTNLSTLVEEGTSKNLLGYTVPVEIVIQ